MSFRCLGLTAVHDHLIISDEATQVDVAERH